MIIEILFHVLEIIFLLSKFKAMGSSFSILHFLNGLSHSLVYTFILMFTCNWLQ